MSRARKVIVVIVAVLLVGLVAFWLFLPTIVIRRVTAEAAARGVELQVGSADVGMNEIFLQDVTVKVHAMPNLQVSADGIRMNHSWLNVSDVSVEGAKVEMSGAPSVAITTANQATSEGGPAAAPPLTVAGQLTWKDAFGLGSTAKCTLSLHVQQLPQRRFGDDASVHCEALRITNGSLSFGPWTLDASRDATGDHLQLGLANSGNVKLTTTPTGLVQADASLVNAQLDQLGLPPSMLAQLPMASAAVLNVDAHLKESTPGHATGTANLGIDGVRVGSQSMPLVLRTDLDGDPRGNLSVSSTTASVGKFNGALTGRITVPNHRADLSFDSTVMSCRDVTAEITNQALGQQLGGLIHALGVDRGVQGSVALHADATLDIDQPAASKLTTKTTGDCSVGVP
jgi:hypothetical protein